jgi:hypothetical protein
MSSNHAFVIVALVLITTVFQIPASAQYCGGTLQYVVRDKEDRVMDAANVEVIENGPRPAAFASIRPPSGANIAAYEQQKLRGKMKADPQDHSGRKPGNIEGMHVSTFQIRMGCGLPLLELSLKLDGDVMNLRFVNISEMDSILDSLPFQSGTFEIDFSNVYDGYPTDKSAFNTTGLKSGDEIFLPWHAKGHALIHSKNWRKVKTK